MLSLTKQRKEGNWLENGCRHCEAHACSDELEKHLEVEEGRAADMGHSFPLLTRSIRFQVLAAESVKKSVNLLNSVLHIKSKKPVCKKKKKKKSTSIPMNLNLREPKNLLCAILFLFLRRAFRKSRLAPPPGRPACVSVAHLSLHKACR